MRYQLIDTFASPNQTSLQGYVYARFDELVELFGDPVSGFDGDKVSTEWDLTFYDAETEREVIATIYDWKEYDGGARARSNAHYQWHVGGHIPCAVAAVNQFLGSR